MVIGTMLEVKLHHCYDKVTYHFMLHLSVFWDFSKSGSLFKKIKMEQEKESIICVRMGLKNMSLRITVCHHSKDLNARW